MKVKIEAILFLIFLKIQNFTEDQTNSHCVSLKLKVLEKKCHMCEDGYGLDIENEIKCNKFTSSLSKSCKIGNFGKNNNEYCRVCKESTVHGESCDKKIPNENLINNCLNYNASSGYIMCNICKGNMFVSNYDKMCSNSKEKKPLIYFPDSCIENDGLKCTKSNNPKIFYHIVDDTASEKDISDPLHIKGCLCEYSSFCFVCMDNHYMSIKGDCIEVKKENKEDENKDKKKSTKNKSGVIIVVVIVVVVVLLILGTLLLMKKRNNKLIQNAKAKTLVV